jgi:Methyltransferase domain/C-methyltransferase C-terminal domain
MIATATRCPSCHRHRLLELLLWPSIPVNAALFPATLAESLAIARGSFRFVACSACGLLFNSDHDRALVEYSDACIETPMCSEHHRAFADALAHAWIERHALRDAPVVEVGCGRDAAFLRTFVEISGGTGTGVDPAIPSSGRDERLTLVAESFTSAHAEIPGRALICRHTLEHISAVSEFLGAVRSWSVANDGAPVLFEVPDAGRIFAEGAFWDVYYEHCSYFTAQTLASTFRLHGLEPDRIELVYDGQYLVAEARPGPQAAPDSRVFASLVDEAMVFARTTTERIGRAAVALRGLREDGPLVVWQAGGKALSLLTLTGAGDAISGLVDANPAKHGRYLPGTPHRILAPGDVVGIGPSNVIVMNRVYVPEVEAILRRLSVAAHVRPVDALFG